MSEVIETLFRAQDSLLSINNDIEEQFSDYSKTCLRCALEDIQAILEEASNAV